MTLTSTAFSHEGAIPSRYTCDGENVSPPLAFHDVPCGAASLALIMDDPDVPKHIRADGMWDHWVVFNMPPDTVGIPDATLPAGTTGLSTGGNNAYGGPCPPDREHRYFFRLYALNAMLTLDATSNKATVMAAMRGHILEEAELMGRYERHR